MAREKSEKSPYKSRFGAGYISAAQWLAENMCDRFARSQGTNLPSKFWAQPYWLKKFKLQLKHANTLLQKYDVSLILFALRHPDAKKVYSLGLTSVLIPLMEMEKKKVERSSTLQGSSSIEIKPISIQEQPRKPFVSKDRNNILKKLRELDCGES